MGALWVRLRSSPRRRRVRHRRLGYLRDRRLGRRRFVYRRGGRAHPRRRDFFLRRRTRRFESRPAIVERRSRVGSERRRFENAVALAPSIIDAPTKTARRRRFARQATPNVGPTDSAETFRVPTRTSDDGGSSSSFSESWKPVSPLPAGGACACACVDDADVRANAVYVLTWGASSPRVRKDGSDDALESEPNRKARAKSGRSRASRRAGAWCGRKRRRRRGERREDGGARRRGY